MYLSSIVGDERGRGLDPCNSPAQCRRLLQSEVAVFFGSALSPLYFPFLFLSLLPSLPHRRRNFVVQSTLPFLDAIFSHGLIGMSIRYHRTHLQPAILHFSLFLLLACFEHSPRLLTLASFIFCFGGGAVRYLPPSYLHAFGGSTEC